ncbi:MAG: ABC transporter ATP-binding protein [Proteobacteria bacterium]|nr:ABC transporter ATP-binding protein [Pseudomonadota bacterium]
MRVELKGVTRSFHEGALVRSVLRDLDLEIEPGQSCVLLGRSGSGKTTLLNLIAGLDAPDAGRVRIDGRDVAALSERERTLLRRRRIGFVFQSYNLIPTLTVAENVRLPRDLDARGGAAGVPDAPERFWLERVGLADRADSFPDRLSGGEQQRVAIARALASGPGLVLADEPTGNLDLETGRGVLDELQGLVRDRGITLLMATHSREMLGRADRVLELRGGRLGEIRA